MQRILYKELLEWKNSRNRKPLLIQGARQVGKTYLINQFGKNEYTDYVYLNFEQDEMLGNLFSKNLDSVQILNDLGLYLGYKINIENTLIFFDEIQAVPRALTSLKYFYEQIPDLHIIAAGSLLGVSVGKQNSFPVGKVNFKTLYPLSFEEFLLVNNEQLLVKHLKTKTDFKTLTDVIHHKLLDYFKIFLYIGGMPEVVNNYINNKDIRQVREIQNEILQAYERDFSKYSEKNLAIKTSEVWHSIPYQLARENKKFKFSNVRKGARSSYYELTISWLKNAGLIYPAYQISVPKLPLAGYADFSKFKIYLLDTGLLGAMLDINSDIIIKPNALFTEYNGAFIENYVANELIKSNEKTLFYWTSKSDAEVDFILQHNNKILPVEVKSGLNRNIKSLRSYASKYNPEYIIRASVRNFYKEQNFINIPLYAIFILKNLIK